MRAEARRAQLSAADIDTQTAKCAATVPADDIDAGQLGHWHKHRGCWPLTGEVDAAAAIGTGWTGFLVPVANHKVLDVHLAIAALSVDAALSRYLAGDRISDRAGQRVHALQWFASFKSNLLADVAASGPA